MRWIPIILGSCLMLACIAGSVANLVNYDLLGLIGFVLCGVAAGVLTIAALIRFSEKTNAPVVKTKQEWLVPGVSEETWGNTMMGFGPGCPVWREARINQLLDYIAQAKRNKKKHSHLQAELDKLRGA